MQVAAELLALSVGLIWAISAFISVEPVRAFGGLAFNRVRQSVVSLGLILAILVSGAFELLTWHQALLLSLSGFVGIFLGDTLLFAALGRLGPRRNAMIFATNAPMAALMAVALGKDVIGPVEWLGIALVLLGVVIAIGYGKPREALHTWEQVRGPLWVGISLSLLAALGQAGGLVLADFVIDVRAEEKPPVLLTALVRVGIAAVALNALAFAGLRAMAPAAPISRCNWMLAVLSGIWGMGLGMTLLVWAQWLGGEAGLIAALSSTTPVWILPVLWLTTRQRPPAPAFVGAAIAVAGVFLIYLP